VSFLSLLCEVCSLLYVVTDICTCWLSGQVMILPAPADSPVFAKRLCVHWSTPVILSRQLAVLP
jgi:hypothetical protein